MMNMKKMMAMLMALMMMFALVACGGKEEAADKIVIGTSADYAPFEFHKMIDGKDTILGADIEMAKKIAAVLGVALITNVYGNAGYAPLMILASVPLYNVFAVVILVLEADGGGKLDRKRLKNAALNVCKNPIILGILAGMPFVLFRWHIPAMAEKTLTMLSNLATPLSLLAIGAAFDWGDALKKAKPTITAATTKLVILPALFLPVAIALGFRDAQLMAILIMLGSPSTPSGYIMAKQMGNDDVLANGIIVLTTLLAAVTITGWIFLLRSFGLL